VQRLATVRGFMSPPWVFHVYEGVTLDIVDSYSRVY
jgi:hypothetical protein